MMEPASRKRKPSKVSTDLECPKCKQRNNGVVDTRFDSGAGWDGRTIVQERIRRRRKCICGGSFTTYEHVYEVIDPRL